jgi:pimeloyl-ACP methyl ester carboxylesterase
MEPWLWPRWDWEKPGTANVTDTNGDATIVGESDTIEGVRLAYWRTTGNHATTLMMLHGMGSDHRGLSELSALLDVGIVAPDLPGYGRSEPFRGRHSLSRYAAAIEQLRCRLGLTRFTLLGHSLGASIAMVYANRYGSSLDALCLLNPVTDAATPAAWMGRLYFGVSGRLPQALARVLLTSRPAVYLSDRALFTSDDWATRRRILHQDYVTARMAAPRAISEGYLSLAQTPFDRCAAAIQTRTLLLTGDRDPLCTPGSLYRLQRGMPRADVAIVRNAGHLLPVEVPAAGAGAINRFLLDGASAPQVFVPKQRERPSELQDAQPAQPWPPTNMPVV